MTMLSRRSSPHGATSTRHALLFRLGDTELALPADQVTTVAEVTSCTRLPSADPTLLGVTRVGTRLLPLIDAHRRLRVAGTGLGAFPWTCVVVRGAVGEVAFRIDEILGLRAVPDGRLPVGCELMPFERLIASDTYVANGE